MQSYLAGICSAMETYLSNFTTSPARVLALERDKMALRKVGRLTLVLIGPVSQPDTSLLADLENLYGVFGFLYGSFATVLGACNGDEALWVDRMREYCAELIPFIKRADGKAYGPLAPLVTTPLPPVSYTHQEDLIFTLPFGVALQSILFDGERTAQLTDGRRRLPRRNAPL